MTGPPEIDPALVRAAQCGDRLAVAGSDGALAPYGGRVCGPIALHDGPDAAQEALIAIFKNLGGLREPGAIYGWARDRGAGGGPGGPARPPGPSRRNSRMSPARGDPQLAADVRDALARLTPGHRAILVLRDLEDWTSRRSAHCLAFLPGPCARGCSGPGAASGRRGCRESGLARGRARPGPPDAGHRPRQPPAWPTRKTHSGAVQRRVGSRQRPGTRTAPHGHRPSLIRDHQHLGRADDRLRPRQARPTTT